MKNMSAFSLGLVMVAVVGAGRLAYAADDSSYSIKVESPPAQKGAKAVAKINITPATGYHVNMNYPTSLTVTAPAGVTVEKPKQGAKDAAKFTEPLATFDVAYTAADAGKKTITGDLKFSVCNASNCEQKKQKVAIDVDVK